MYLSASRLTRLVLGLVAHVICTDKVQHLREEFVAMDTDHSGTLSTVELFHALGDKLRPNAYVSVSRPEMSFCGKCLNTYIIYIIL